MTNFGKRIMKYRKLKGLTQEELGSMCGISRQLICLYEGDKAEPPLSALIALIRALGITPNVLLRGTFEDTVSSPEDPWMTHRDASASVPSPEHLSACARMIADALSVYRKVDSSAL